jgi:transposase-like protein
MKGHGAKLPQKQDEAIIALLASPSVEVAAKKVGIAASTLFRWMQDDEFKGAYRGAKAAYVSQALALLQQSTTEAVSTLREIMLDTDKPASARVASAKTILDTAIKAVELEDLVIRIEKIEKAVIIYQVGKQ